MAGNWWKLMDLHELAGTGWTLLELAKNGWNCWKWLKIAGCLEWLAMIWNGCQWLTIAENGWKSVEIFGNWWNGWKWLEINEAWWTWLKMAWNGWKWLEMAWMQSVTVTFWRLNTNTEYYSVFRNIRITNTTQKWKNLNTEYD